MIDNDENSSKWFSWVTLYYHTYITLHSTILLYTHLNHPAMMSPQWSKDKKCV